MQPEGNRHSQVNAHGASTQCRGPVPPLHDGPLRCLIEKRIGRLQDIDFINGAVRRDDGLEDHHPFLVELASGFRVCGLHALDQQGRSDIATDVNRLDGAARARLSALAVAGASEDPGRISGSGLLD